VCPCAFKAENVGAQGGPRAHALEGQEGAARPKTKKRKTKKTTVR